MAIGGHIECCLCFAMRVIFWDGKRVAIALSAMRHAFRSWTKMPVRPEEPELWITTKSGENCWLGSRLF